MGLLVSLWIVLFCHTCQCHLSTTSSPGGGSSWFWQLVSLASFFLFPRMSLIKFPETRAPQGWPNPSSGSRFQLCTCSLRIQGGCCRPAVAVWAHGLLSPQNSAITKASGPRQDPSHLSHTWGTRGEAGCGRFLRREQVLKLTSAAVPQGAGNCSPAVDLVHAGWSSPVCCLYLGARTSFINERTRRR